MARGCGAARGAAALAIGIAGCAGVRGEPAAEAPAGAMPALPEGVEELKFGDFYRRPIGAQGLEFSERMASLDGRRVRVLGYMVRQSRPAPRTLLLSPVPMTLHEEEYGFAEDLPPQILHVLAPDKGPEDVPFTPGLLLLTGRLELGAREEPDGRVSHARLFLDEAPRDGGPRS